MAQIFKINGTTLTYITKADWLQNTAQLGLDGHSSIERWAIHSWKAEVMSETEFNTLYALEGQKVSIITTNHTDRNGDYLTYYGVDLDSVIGNHNGPIFENVSLSFKVRL